ncbi:hypothetical protein SUGI_0656220 [Cryptomeria japonica]|nr:hypothetical protein SUGI_0656220 [Cryptomeria japonica]
MNWIKGGDKGTNYFFNLIRDKNKWELIEDIQVNNLTTNDPIAIKEAFFSFYNGLFSSEHGDINQEALEKCLLLIPKKISCEKVKALSHKISLEEIKSAITSLENGKSPGIDSLPAEFYKKHLDWVSLELFALYEDVFIQNSLGENINKGVIKLLPKGGDKTLVKNWRPITLLNISYKITAKVLARRIARLLDKFIFAT